MTLKLKPSNAPATPKPFSWDDELNTTPATSPPPEPVPSPPTLWLTAQDMKMYGAKPLRSEIGIVKCNLCEKPILRSAAAQHTVNCEKIRAGSAKKGTKAKVDEGDSVKKGKKRKAESEDEGGGAKKKTKATPKVTKGRFKGPVDYDKQCGVINDKNLPCSRSLTCKSHSMGAKRAVLGRSRPYDELLLEWNRANNPNWVEPVKRETKAERKEKKEKEKAERQKAREMAATTAGPEKKSKKGKKASGAVATTGIGVGISSSTGAIGEDDELEDIDSEVEVDNLVRAVRNAQFRGVIGVPLAVPCDAGSWFVMRRERLRNCRDLLSNALMSRGGGGMAASGGSFVTGRPA